MRQDATKGLVKRVVFRISPVAQTKTPTRPEPHVARSEPGRQLRRTTMAQAHRLTRRIVGMLNAREADLQLHAVEDKRAAHLVTWRLDVMLRLSIVCPCSGCKSLAEAEQRTAEMT